MTNTINIDATNTNTVIGKVEVLHASYYKTGQGSNNRPTLKWTPSKHVSRAHKLLSIDLVNEKNRVNIYGVPGVGKTTVLHEYIAQLENNNLSFLQVELEDGIAVERIKEAIQAEYQKITGITVTNLRDVFEKISNIDQKLFSSVVVILDGKNVSRDLINDFITELNSITVNQNKGSSIQLIVISREKVEFDGCTNYIEIPPFTEIEVIQSFQLLLPDDSRFKHLKPEIESEDLRALRALALELNFNPLQIMLNAKVLSFNPTMTLHQWIVLRRETISKLGLVDTMSTEDKSILTAINVIFEDRTLEKQIFQEMVSLPKPYFSESYLRFYLSQPAVSVIDFFRAAGVVEESKRGFWVHDLIKKAFCANLGESIDAHTTKHAEKYNDFITNGEFVSTYNDERVNILILIQQSVSTLKQNRGARATQKGLWGTHLALVNTLLEKLDEADNDNYFNDVIISLNVHQLLLRWQLENTNLSDTEKIGLKQQIMGDLARLFGTLANAGKFGEENTPGTALFFAQQRLHLAENWQDLNQQSRPTGNIGALFGMMNRYIEAAQNNQKALELAEEFVKQNPTDVYLWLVGLYCNQITFYQDIAYDWLKMNVALKQRNFTWLPDAVSPSDEPKSDNSLMFYQLHLFKSQLDSHIQQFTPFLTSISKKISEYYEKLKRYFKIHTDAIKEDPKALGHYYSAINSYANYLVAKAQFGQLNNSLAEEAMKRLMAEAHQLYREVAQENTPLGYAGLVYWCSLQEDIHQANYWLKRSIKSKPTKKELTKRWTPPTKPHELNAGLLKSDSLMAFFIKKGDHDNLRPIVTERLPELIEIAKEKAKSAAETSFKYKQDHREQEAQAADTEYEYYIKHARLYTELIIKANRAMFETLNQPVE